jgi:hypothetical protein
VTTSTNVASVEAVAVHLEATTSIGASVTIARRIVAHPRATGPLSLQQDHS